MPYRHGVTRRLALRIVWLALALVTLALLIAVGSIYAPLIAFVAWCGGIVFTLVFLDLAGYDLRKR